MRSLRYRTEGKMSKRPLLGWKSMFLRTSADKKELRLSAGG